MATMTEDRKRVVRMVDIMEDQNLSRETKVQILLNLLDRWRLDIIIECGRVS